MTPSRSLGKASGAAPGGDGSDPGRKTLTGCCGGAWLPHALWLSPFLHPGCPCPARCLCGEEKPFPEPASSPPPSGMRHLWGQPPPSGVWAPSSNSPTPLLWSPGASRCPSSPSREPAAPEHPGLWHSRPLCGTLCVAPAFLLAQTEPFFSFQSVLWACHLLAVAITRTCSRATAPRRGHAGTRGLRLIPHCPMPPALRWWARAPCMGPTALLGTHGASLQGQLSHSVIHLS